MKRINIANLAVRLKAYKNCVKANKEDWQEIHKSQICEMLENLPSGSGLDNGVKFDWDNSNDTKLIFKFSYHHLNEDGYYDGWTDHVLTLTPTFVHGFDLKISGKDKNNTKDYLYDLFNEVFTLREDVNV